MPTAKKPTRFDPDQLFQVRTISRRCVAEALNAAIEEENLKVKSFADDDARLTDKVCQDFADALFDGESDSCLDNQSYVEAENALELARKFAT